MTSSSSYVQRSQGNLTTHSRYDTIEKTTSYSTSSKHNNYAVVDASRVRAQGDGLVRAYRNEKATFTVDTREGGKLIFNLNKSSFCFIYILIFKGNAMLMVGVFGPKYPCEEVFIKHIGNNQYNVQYVKIS
jgi:filamin